jgi:hypothetical protein
VVSENQGISDLGSRISDVIRQTSFSTLRVAWPTMRRTVRLGASARSTRACCDASDNLSRFFACELTQSLDVEGQLLRGRGHKVLLPHFERGPALPWLHPPVIPQYKSGGPPLAKCKASETSSGIVRQLRRRGARSLHQQITPRYRLLADRLLVRARSFLACRLMNLVLKYPSAEC